MAEFNPYKLEEEKWTPNNVYEILSPNAVSWSDYDFGQGTDNVDRGAAEKSFIDGFVDFFKDLFGVAGQILGGALELGGKILGGFVEGVANFIGGIANAIGSIFGGGNSESPNPPLFNPIKTNLEAAIQPHRDKIDESWQKTEEILAEQEVLRGQMAVNLDEMRDARDRADEAIEQSGKSIAEAEAASDAAEAAREQLEAYNTALNQRITQEFNSAVGRADTAINKAETLAGELADFKAQHQREIAEAIGKAEQANEDLAALSPQVDSALEKSSAANQKVADLTPQVTAASDKAGEALSEAARVQEDLSKKISTAQTKGENALAAADKAIADSEFVAGFADDLIPKDAAGKSTWGRHLEPGNESPAESAFGSERTYIMSSSNKAPEPFIPVKGQEVYRLTLWVKEHLDSASNGFSFHLRSATNYAGWTHSRMNFGEWLTQQEKNNPYDRVPSEEWRKYTIDFRWPESAGPAYVQLNQNAGGKFYVHDVQVRVIAPVDNSVDLAQNDAIRALNDTARQQGEINEAQRVANLAQDKLNEKQDEWNAGVTAALETQETVNDNFKKWSDGAANAIEANTNAIKALNAPQMGSSIVPLIPGTTEPAWTEGLTKNFRGAQTADSVLPEGVKEYYRWRGGRIAAGTLETHIVSRENLVAVDANVEYEASWYVRSSAGSPRYAYITLTDDRGNSHIVKKSKDGEASAYTWGNPVRAIITPVTTTWTKQTTRFALEPGTRAVRISEVQFNNQGNSSDSYIYVAGLEISPKVPNQLDVDSAQNDAIAANTEALKALGKKVLGASLVPYKTPSTQEVKDYAAGKLNYDPWNDPEYLNAGHRVMSPARGRVAHANPGEGTKTFRGSYVTVDSSIEYKVKFHTYTGSAGSRIYIHMYDQNGDHAVATTPFSDAVQGTNGLVAGLTLPRGVKEWSGVVKFKPGTTQVQLGNFYWNYTGGTTNTTQEFGGLEIVPNIPDANVVNELQDNAIRKNTEVGSDNKAAIEALRDGLSASIELETVNELIGGLEERIHQEEKARAKLQAKIDDLQNEMIPRTIVWESGRETLDDYISIPASNRIVALPGWTGQMVVTSVLRRGRGTEREPTYYQTSIDRYSVPDGTSRSWTLPSGTSYEGITSLRVDYWIYRGKTRAINMANGGGYITGSSYVRGSERTIASYKVGKTYGTGQIEWRAQLKNANRGTTYRFIVRVTGQPDKTFTWSSVGPLTGLGSGLVTLKFDHEFNLPDNATVSIVAYTNASTSSRAIVNYSMGILTYVENTQ